MMFRLAILLLICAGSASAADPSPRQRGDLALRSRAILKKYCSECHAPGGQSFDILDHGFVTGGKHPVAFVDTKPGGRSQIIEFLEDGSMPPAGKQRPNEGEINTLKKWIAAGAPQYPKSFDDAAIANVVQADWQSRTSAEDYRYVSLANRIADSSGFKGFEAEEARLRSALQASTTNTRAIDLQQVDPAGVVYRLNVKKLGWLERDKFQEIIQQKPSGAAEFVAVDLIQLEYPFPIPDAARFAKQLSPSKYAATVPVYRGDWLADALAPGSLLAVDMRSMVELAEAKEGEEPVGPKIPTAGWKAPTGTVPPLTAWYAEDRPGSFGVNLTIKDKTPPYSVVANDPVPLEATATDRDARAVLFNVLSNGSVRLQNPLESFLKKGEAFSFKGAGGPIRLSPLTGADSTVERFILFAAEDELPKFTVVRSKHSEDFDKKDHAPIWRIVVEQNAKFDPAKVVRKVVSITVTRKK